MFTGNQTRSARAENDSFERLFAGALSKKVSALKIPVLDLDKRHNSILVLHNDQDLSSAELAKSNCELVLVKARPCPVTADEIVGCATSESKTRDVIRV